LRFLDLQFRAGFAIDWASAHPGGAMIDVQASSGASKFAIESVGITSLTYPIIAGDAATGEHQSTVANWQLGVDLEAARRGTHMSRFITALDEIAAKPLDLDGTYRFACDISRLLHADSSQVSASFRWFRRVAAPVSGRSALLESEVTFKAISGPKARKSLTVKVAAKSLCPCSKAVSERGAHNQRSELKLTVHLHPDAKTPSINELLGLLERSASSPVYPVLKREDEKFVTEAAYDQPVFVEDIVRAAAEQASTLDQLAGFEVEAVNRESIHAHDCFARISYP